MPRPTSAFAVSRRLLAFVIPVIATLGLPRVAAADQQFSWLNYCTVGSLQMCASVEVTVVPSGNQTLFTVRMRNLQGTLGTTPYRFFNLGFQGLLQTNSPPVSWAFPQKATLSGTASFHIDDPLICSLIPPCPAPNWGTTQWFYRTTSGGRGNTNWEQDANGAMMDNIMGCGDVSSIGGWGSFQTCGDGWVEVTFALFGGWAFDENTTMQWRAFSDDGQVDCNAGVDCFQATPEPVTIVLLSTGLLGIGAVRRRKSRTDVA